VFRKKPPTELENEITRLHELLKGTAPETKEYSAIADQLTKLYKLRETSTSERISPNVVLSAAANLVGILVVLQHERIHVVTSKALSMVTRIK